MHWQFTRLCNQDRFQLNEGNLYTDASIHKEGSVYRFQGNLYTDASIHKADAVVQEAGTRGYTLMLIKPLGVCF